MKAVNQKLRKKIQDLNATVEKAIEKANSKRLLVSKRENQEIQDVSYLIKIRDKEIENSEKLIKNNQNELDKLNAKYADLQEAGNLSRLRD